MQAEQNLQKLPRAKASEEEAEWAERQRLSRELRQALTLSGQAQQDAVTTLLDPYWGLSQQPDSDALRRLLAG